MTDGPAAPSATASVRTAVVLAAGAASRMRRADPAARLDTRQARAADAGAKPLIPVPKPFLDYVLSALADAGVLEVCLVVASGESPIRARYESMATRRLRLAFAVQGTPRGTADAALAAEVFVAGADFLLLNADNYYPTVAYRTLCELDGPGLPVFDRETLVERGNVAPERIARYATLKVGRDDFLERIDEKPDAATFAAVSAAREPVLVSMNLWRFSPAIFEACRQVPVSARGERELPQAVQLGIDRMGLRFRTFRCAEGVLDLSTRADVESVSRALSGAEVRL